MKFDRIERLVAEEDFAFQAWDDRYGKGVWAALGRCDHEVDTVRDLSSDGDLDMIPAMDYVFSADWLPYVTGDSLAEAMQALEQRLAQLPPGQLCRDSLWATLVSEAIDALSDATRGRSWYGNAKPKTLANLPATFELALAAKEETEAAKAIKDASAPALPAPALDAEHSQYLEQLKDLMQKSKASDGKKYAHFFEPEHMAVRNVVSAATFAAGQGVVELSPTMDDQCLAVILRWALKASDGAGFRVLPAADAPAAPAMP